MNSCYLIRPPAAMPIARLVESLILLLFKMPFDTKRFIVEIKNRLALWDTSSNEYADRDLKKKCWEEIIEIFKEKEDMTTQEKKEMGYELQKKWKNIRGCFMREIGRQKALKSGSDAGPRKSEYKYFKKLQFLKKVTNIRKPTHPTTPEVKHSQKDLDHDQFRPQKIQKEGNNSESGDDPLLKVLTKSIEQRQKDDFAEQDEDKLFLLSLVTTLKKVPEHKKIATKIKIMSLLEEATQ